MGLEQTVYLEEKKMMGFRQTVDLKLIEIIKVKGKKIMGCEQTVYLKKNNRFLTNHGIKSGIAYIGKGKKIKGL